MSLNTNELLDDELITRGIETYKYPALVIWGIIPLILFWGWGDQFPYSTIDIQNHNTYFVIARLHIAIPLMTYFGIVGLIYWWLRKSKMNIWFTNIHLSFTLFCIPFLFYDFNSKFIPLNSMNDFRLVVGFILGQILFLFRMIILGINKLMQAH